VGSPGAFLILASRAREWLVMGHGTGESTVAERPAAIAAGLAARSAVVATAAVPALAAPPRPAAARGAEQISRYFVRIAIRRDGSVLVTEQILYDFGGDRRHGILRDIPVLSPYSLRYNRYLRVAVRSVTSDTGDVPYSVSTTGGSVVIKAGDPHRVVTGMHEYWLDYLVRGGMSIVGGRDELRWNAIGDQWAIPISNVRVVVISPTTTVGVNCWAGIHGSTTRCGLATTSAAGSAVFVQRRLSPYEGLTVAVDLPQGSVNVPPPLLRERWRSIRS